jgi:hypothetical protein
MGRIAAALEGGGLACTRLIRSEHAGRPASVYARLQTYNVHGVHAALAAAGLQTVQRKPQAGA